MQHKLNSAKDKGVADVSLWLPWQSYHLGNLVYDDFELPLGTYAPDTFLIRFQKKEFWSKTYFPFLFGNLTLIDTDSLDL